MIKKILICCLLSFISYAIDAAHIIGGDVIYKCISSDATLKRTKFEIVFTMYRDSKGSGAQFDLGAQFGLFKSDDNGATWDYISTHISDPRDIEDVNYFNPCIIIPPNIGVQKATYTFDVDLDWGTSIYQVAYQRCCRNGTITNINFPGATGAAFVVEIYPDAISSCNNSPVFKNFPPTVICQSDPLRFDHSALDKEGDFLTYEFCSPLSSGGTDGENNQGDPTGCQGVRPAPIKCGPPFAEVDFIVPDFSPSNPLGGNPSITISNSSGEISGTPIAEGQYVVGVCVKEFRNGKLIGTIRRDFQFNVTKCQIAVDARIDIDKSKVSNGYIEVTRLNNGGYYVKSCGSNEIPFINSSVQEVNLKGFKWTMNNVTKQDTFSSKNLTYSYPKIGKYRGKLIINPELSNCSDTASLEIDILPALNADFSYSYDTCVAGAISFRNKTTSIGGTSTPFTYNWLFEPQMTSILEEPNYTYATPGVKKIKLEATDVNGCVNVREKDVLYQPVPALLVVEPTQFTGCRPASIFFNNLSRPIDSTYRVDWEFGDGKKINKISPSHTYDSTGIYDVKVTITSPIGCVTSRTFTDWIEILDKPKAAFDYTPKVLNNFNKTATFTNESQRQKSVVWSFGGAGTTFTSDPVFTFPDTGIYEVVLLAVHSNGCVDTATALIDVAPLVTLQMPNAFTPNNDGLNDDFKGYGYFDGISGYKMTIWNRWGEKIYESLDPNQGWTGEKNNIGILSPQGVYAYLIEYITSRQEVKNLKGHVTLIR